ncbi:MAG: hypothetical protein II844_07170 [Prevotella sp.]|nr:hypothetical protein [Prevotella sp.]
MSYDIMIIDHQPQFKDGKEFYTWYNNVTQWNDTIDYNDYRHTTNSLQQLFLEMKDVVRPLNGEFAPSDDELETGEYLEADYSIGKDFIYIALAWTDCEKTSKKAFELAQKYKLAYFDASGDEELHFPDGRHILVSERQLIDDADVGNTQKENRSSFGLYAGILLLLILSAIYFFVKR